MSLKRPPGPLACAQMIKRTEGVSTTDIVGRMLMCTTRPSAQAVSAEGPSRFRSRAKIVQPIEQLRSVCLKKKGKASNL